MFLWFWFLLRPPHPPVYVATITHHSTPTSMLVLLVTLTYTFVKWDDGWYYLCRPFPSFTNVTMSDQTPLLTTVSDYSNTSPPSPTPQHTNTHIPKQITKIFNSTLVGGLKHTQKLMALWQKYLNLVLQFSSTKVWKYINILKGSFSIWYTSLIRHAPGQISLDSLVKNAHTKAVNTR